ncbi:alpha-amylase family glycosyl hydrolase [Paenibacillus sediminis]|uniref:Alpha-amylase n=1 Tax=Paenibacillus sediminis TaxID=664909 RepID=A0ABS4H2K8_9BACL|nr:alpha-amylase family glycosyl hydrolase [Paenibacillus sediminis]MBP1936612.1 glycosidase [Paenibacillus sediminis]
MPHSYDDVMVILMILCFVIFGIPYALRMKETGRIGFDEHDTIYQVMVDRFYDGDPSNNATGPAIRYAEECEEDFRYMKGGDWQGVIDKLDYIERMGFTAIWISPVAEPQMLSRDNGGTGRNTAYHGYNMKDPNRANPYFGTKEKLKELVDQAHTRGMKIIIDVVPNHVGDYLLGTNAYYDQGDLQPAPPFNNPDWYHHYGDLDWSLVEGNYSQWAQDYIECHDLSGLDDIDHDHPEAKQAIFDSIKGWIDYTGADAARVDAAKMMRPSVVRDLEQHLGVPTFSEVLDYHPPFIAQWVGPDGGWGLLDFPLLREVVSSFAYGESFERTLKWLFAQDYVYQGNEQRMVTFIDNHDRNRFLTEAGGDVRKLQNALTFIFMARGIPAIFQGTEQNKGNAHGQLVSGGAADTWNRWSMVKRDAEGRVLEDYFRQDTDTYQHIAELNEIRRTYEALRTGKQREMWASQHLYAFSRRVENGWLEGQEVIAVFSNSDIEQTEVIPLRAESSLPAGMMLNNVFNPSDQIVIEQGGVTGRQLRVRVEAHSAKAYVVTRNNP